MTTSRGEYKVPGGKLVAAEVTFDGEGTVRFCRLSGDFFADAPTNAQADALLRGVETALVSGRPVQSVMDMHPTVSLVGTDAAAIETAYARAVGNDDSQRNAVAAAGHASGNHDASERHSDRERHDAVDYAARWEQFTHNLTVVHDVPRSPGQQMELDETWAREVACGQRGPTLRIWEWAGPAVVIGRFQSAPDEVNLDVAERLGFDVVRRCTGGGAMFIEPGNTITYSLYAPLEFVRGVGIEESYRLCDWWLVEALRDLSLDVRFTGLNDIASQYGKIGGAAQRRFPAPRDDQRATYVDTGSASHSIASVSGLNPDLGSGSVLHHVTMAYDIDAATMATVLNTSREKMSDKAVKSAVKRVDPLRSQTGMAREEIINHLIGWFGAQTSRVTI
ncbi:lipoate--protein ligase family protein [Bifidobacterium olomucense]|uniref:Ligase n=1 Tax=Bifidobacterium olomucense TaxID=2675324 RepID=A0A7Y0HY70_9BIFI|nr:lipoate--protein ligase family protein [Bifidobacterium sp. DSM 109959]NMM98794.1 ligase [Bifidobacterium sp. DSM 109959]